MNFHKVLYFVIISILLLLFGCGRTNNYIADSETLLRVNNDAVSVDMYEKSRSELAYSEYTDIQLIEGLALESFVLQQGAPLNVSVSKQEVQERYNELCNINDIYLEKVSEKYSDKKDLFEALYYRILYEKVQSNVQIEANDKFQFHEELLRQRTEDYLLKYNFDSDKREEYFSTVYNSYIDIQNSEIKELYFKAWQYRIVDRTALSSDNYDLSLLFCDIPYAIDQLKMSYGTDEYATYNQYCNSIDITTFDNILLRIDCSKAEDGLKITPNSQCALNALAIDEPMEYARLVLDGEMQAWIDAEDSLEVW